MKAIHITNLRQQYFLKQLNEELENILPHQIIDIKYSAISVLIESGYYTEYSVLIIIKQ